MFVDFRIYQIATDTSEQQLDISLWLNNLLTGYLTDWLID